MNAMTTDLEQLEAQALADLSSADDAASLETWRVKYIGSKGLVKGAMAGIGRASCRERV